MMLAVELACTGDKTRWRLAMESSGGRAVATAEKATGYAVCAVLVLYCSALPRMLPMGCDRSELTHGAFTCDCLAPGRNSPHTI